MGMRWTVAVFAASMLLPQISKAAELSGKWVAMTGVAPAAQYTRVTLSVSGDKLSGTWGTATIDGTLLGGQLTIKLTDEQGKPAGELTGTVSGDSISGSGTISPSARNGRGPAAPLAGAAGRAAAPGPVAFVLTRSKMPPAQPREITYNPTTFLGTYSAANKPELTIFPGDVVHTWITDADGVDAKGVRHRGGDDNVGPIYVEGALPGDTLAVHLLKVRTNRSYAYQGTHLNAHAVTAAYLVGAQYDPAVDGQWTLLPEKGIAVPTHPSEHMKNYNVPLRPMLGCVSVAPQGDQQYRGGDLGPFGGNLDYNQVVEGATLYFPVFHPGALLGMGDGHAAMGDGEVLGSGLETSLDVDFSVEVIPGDSTGMMRMENKDYLIAFGVSGSVPVSIQTATSQLATWIKQKYKLSDSEVAILFASTLKYDLTEVVDSRYDVVAKVPKSVLATMQ